MCHKTKERGRKNLSLDRIEHLAKIFCLHSYYFLWPKSKATYFFKALISVWILLSMYFIVWILLRLNLDRSHAWLIPEWWRFEKLVSSSTMKIESSSTGLGSKSHNLPPKTRNVWNNLGGAEKIPPSLSFFHKFGIEPKLLQKSSGWF